MTAQRGPVDIGRVPVKADGGSGHPYRRARDAATLLLIDRSADAFRVLVGKRASAHAFMPDMYVFPGGRRDAGDGRTSASNPIRADVLGRLMQRTSQRFSTTTAHGLAIAAARELEEEVALSLTPHAVAGFQPDLSKLRLVARAITPPGRPRRFDTRFFACFTDEIDADTDLHRDSAELTDLTWLPISAPDSVELPFITKLILTDLAGMLERDPNLSMIDFVPFYYEKRGRFLKDRIV